MVDFAAGQGEQVARRLHIEAEEADLSPDSKDTKGGDARGRLVGMGIAIGAGGGTGLGLALGAALLDKPASGLPIGIAVGAAIGAVIGGVMEQRQARSDGE